MRQLTIFNQVSLDGFIADASGDMSWAHKDDAEWNEYVASNASGGGELVFGRVTYEQMASFWPTPFAREAMPEVAAGMNRLPKVVFSKTLAKADWNNTRLFDTDVPGTVERLKLESGKGLVVMGSASIVQQLAAAGLIDAYQLIINPMVLGAGISMFKGVDKLQLKLGKTRVFANGNVLLNYERALPR
jgi:dihydrofolate reductase